MRTEILNIKKIDFEKKIIIKLNKEDKKVFEGNYQFSEAEGVYNLKENLDDAIINKITTKLKSIGFLSFLTILELAEYLRKLEKRYILLFAYNGTGKTRLSMDFSHVGKQFDADGNITARDTLYFNAFTEDLFSWDNDLDSDIERRLLINKYSKFVTGVRALDMDNKIRPLIHRYSNFNFILDYEYKDKEGREFWAVNFIREENINGTPQNVEFIKISRGEENLFIWCFFLAVAQLAIDRHQNYDWVKYIYVDDPVSSLDDNNTIAIAHHLGRMLKNSNGDVKSIVSTHHALFFNVVCNELGNSAPRLFLSKSDGVYFLKDTTDSPFFYHVSMIQDLQKAINSDNIYTYHFYYLRTILEKAANFHGFNGFENCVIVDDDDDEKKLFTRMVNNLNHGGYSMFEPMEMGEENKKYFKQIFKNFMTNYKFNEDLLEKPKVTETV